MEVFLKSHHARFKCGLSNDTQENWLRDITVTQTVTHDSPVTFYTSNFQLTADF